MTGRHILFHLASFGAAALTVFGALVAIFFILPRIPSEFGAFGWAFVIWQVIMALVITGCGIANFRWGFITARPMWIMIAACGLTGWLIPLGIWGFLLWQEEREYLSSWRQHMRDLKSESKLGGS